MTSKGSFNIMDSVSAIPGNIYYKDKEGVILWCNESQLQTLGLTHINQVLGKTIFDLCDYETASKIRAVDLRIMTTGIPEITEEEGVCGNLRVTLSYKAPLKNAEGEIIGIVGNSINIGSQHEARKQLMQENYTKKTALENILTNLPGNIYWKDIDGVLLGCNDKQASYFGLKNAQEFIGKTVFDLLDQESAQRVRDSDLHVMHNNTVEIVEEPVKINGKEHVFITHKSPLKDPGTGKIIGVIGVSIDITLQKELEQILKQRTQDLTLALELKQRFIRNINHEIRTPMQAILNGPQALKDNFYNTSDEEKMFFIDGMLEASLRLNKLVTNILDISKFQEGKFILQLKQENLKNLLEEIVQEFKLSPGDIRVDIDKNVQESISCDKFRLHQVLRNLIVNSIKYAGPEKPITITASNYLGDRNKYLKFSVKDEGIGIPSSEKDAIFEPFVEGKRTRTNAGGTGLGLSISKEIIQSHNGKIWIEDVKNGEVGARVSFTIPAEF